MIVYTLKNAIFQLSFFNGQGKLKFETVQAFHFLMKTFSFDFKETLLTCVDVELVSHIISVSSCSKQKIYVLEKFVSQGKSKFDIKKVKWQR